MPQEKSRRVMGERRHATEERRRAAGENDGAPWVIRQPATCDKPTCHGLERQHDKGRKDRFGLGVNRGILPYMGAFSEHVFAIVRQVPCGKVTTYGQVAGIMGRPQSARYVGFALRGNPSPGNSKDDVPCHRVVFKDGSLCKGYAFGGPDAQRKLLESEGVPFCDESHVDLSACLWNGRVGNAGNGEPAASSSDGDRDESRATPTPHAFNEEPLGPPPDFDWKRELEG